MALTKTDKNALEQMIAELHMESQLPTRSLKAGTVLYRVQSAFYTTANHYNLPRERGRLGRYNDPDMLVAVWYGAQLPTGALAEVFGRERLAAGSQARGLAARRYLNWVADLAHRHMCEVQTTAPLDLLDIKRCLTYLAYPIDEITGPGYMLTQEIVRVVSRLPGQPALLTSLGTMLTEANAMPCGNCPMLPRRLLRGRFSPLTISTMAPLPSSLGKRRFPLKRC